VVKVLLVAGADVGLRNNSGMTAQMLADSSAVVEVLNTTGPLAGVRQVEHASAEYVAAICAEDMNSKESLKITTDFAKRGVTVLPCLIELVFTRRIPPF
jgi:ankyrin repeat protein